MISNKNNTIDKKWEAKYTIKYNCGFTTILYDGWNIHKNWIFEESTSQKDMWRRIDFEILNAEITRI